MASLLSQFWAWYERHVFFATAIAAGLFLFQLIHLYWLTTHVVALRLFGESYFTLSPLGTTIMSVVDYSEVTAIISTSLVYINEYRKNESKRALFYLALLNSQWLHIFWITDEVVLESIIGIIIIPLPALLSWGATIIDYLEIPVIIDILRQLFTAMKERDTKKIRQIIQK